MNITPIKSESDYNAALIEVHKLMDVQPNTAEGDYLDVLVTLIEAYEARYFPIDFPDPIEAIKFRMEQQGLNQKALEPMIGQRSHVSEVLAKKRSLSLRMIRKLHQKLDIPSSSLIKEYKLASALPQQKHVKT
jgi:HTH-type transcriptional regulator/antitoxin HigA